MWSGDDHFVANIADFLYFCDMKRYEWADWGKALAIYSVVLLHTHCYAPLSIFINAFGMPLFFFISGFLFSFERNPEYKPFVKKRFRQIMVPYFWINLITYLAWLLVLRNFGTNTDDNAPWYIPLVAIFGGIPTWMLHDVPLWSLVAFFVAEIIFYPLARATKSNGAIAGIIALAATFLLYYLVPNSIVRYLPLAFGPSIMGVAFYSLGHYCRNTGFLSKKGNPWIESALIAVCGTGFYFLALLNGRLAFYQFVFHNLALSYVVALLAIILFVSLCRLLSHFGEPRIIRFISYGTLLICGFHLLMFSAIKGVAFFGFGVNPEWLTDSLPKGILFSITALLLCLPIVYAVKRWARFLIDK